MRAGQTRKEFLNALAAAAGALMIPGGPLPAAGQTAGPLEPATPAPLPRRALGATGEATTILGLGGAHLARVAGEAQARQMVDVALEQGIRFFDTAESYSDGRSERWLGASLEAVRGDVFLMSKTYDLSRTRESARRHLEGSLERLRTDHLDLWQLHSIQSPEDVDRAFAPGAAMAYILEMQRQGVVRRVGVTGHARPEAHLRALDWFDRGLRFDCMQLPINPIDFHQLSFQKAVLPGLLDRGIGVIAMKTSADGRLLQHGVCTIEECLRFVWALPVSVAVVGMESAAQIQANAALARGAPLPPGEAEALLARIEARRDLGLEWYKRG